MKIDNSVNISFNNNRCPTKYNFLFYFIFIPRALKERKFDSQNKINFICNRYFEEKIICSLDFEMKKSKIGLQNSFTCNYLHRKLKLIF